MLWLGRRWPAAACLALVIGCAQGAVDPRGDGGGSLVLPGTGGGVPVGSGGAIGSGGTTGSGGAMGGDCGNMTCGGSGTCCARQCVDLKSNTLHCGTCDIACPANSMCVTGKCTCDDPNKAICKGVCVDITADSNNCGTCGTMCNAPTTCMSGMCKCSDCTTANDVCAGKCTDTKSDANNCGTCGMKCKAPTACQLGV